MAPCRPSEGSLSLFTLYFQRAFFKMVRRRLHLEVRIMSCSLYAYSGGEGASSCASHRSHVTPLVFVCVGVVSFVSISIYMSHPRCVPLRPCPLGGEGFCHRR